MVYRITTDCILCGACVKACESNAIVEDLYQFRILPERCTNCKKCVDACPIDCITPAEPEAEAV